MLTAAEVQSIVNALLGLGTPQVALRFTALTGSSQIDDVYVDPHASWWTITRPASHLSVRGGPYV